MVALKDKVFDWYLLGMNGCGGHYKVCGKCFAAGKTRRTPDWDRRTRQQRCVGCGKGLKRDA